MKTFLPYIFFTGFLCSVQLYLFAQIKEKEDTFFLLKHKGLLKRLGENIYRQTTPDIVNPEKVVDPFWQYQGKRIRFISVAPTGFYTIVHDTVDGHKKNFLENMADIFHKNTLPKVIRKNLFFREGDKIYPLALSDNERFLRDQPFLQDARILVVPDSTNTTMVDIIILTRDVFSIGIGAQASDTKSGEVTLKDENIFGSGNKLEISSLYDQERSPDWGFGVNFTKRNIRHTFINWTTGFKNYNQAIKSGKLSENNIFTSFDKPLLSRYNAWTGGATFSFNSNYNGYADSTFNKEYKYSNFSSDTWAGFNIGFNSKKEDDGISRLRHFVAARGFYNIFLQTPEIFKINYDNRFANQNGFLASYSLYRQNFYRTNFIYGFGRSEDVPEGLNATIVGGYLNKQGIKRQYYGLEFDGTHYMKRGTFSTYTFRAESFVNESKLQDASLLLGINKFTRLYKLNNFWRNRNFLTINYTRQFNNSQYGYPLYLESGYGLPYFKNVGYPGDTRTTIKVETVFYNLKKLLGFRFAPFVFTDVSFLKQEDLPTSTTNGYTALGGGLRARNENLVFGTIEVKAYYFPRTVDDMKNWRVDFTTKLRFTFNSNFIRRPDFVSAN